MSMPCVFPLLGAQCYYPFSCSSSFYLRTWSTLSWHSTSLYWGSLPYRMFFSTTHSFPFSWQYLLRKFLWHLCSLSLYRATLLPYIKRFLPKPWNDDLIVWHFPYFRCMSHACHFICPHSRREWIMMYL